MQPCTDRPVVGAVGFAIFIDTGLDLSSASSVKIRYQKPGGDTGEWTAEDHIEEIDGETVYGARYVTTDAADLDEEGTWTLQVHVVMSTFTGAGWPAKLKVLPAIALGE